MQYQLTTIRVEVDRLLDGQVWSYIVIRRHMHPLLSSWVRASFRWLAASSARPSRVVTSSFELRLCLLLEWLRRCNEELLRTKVLHEEARPSSPDSLWLCINCVEIVSKAKIKCICRCRHGVHVESMRWQSIQSHFLLIQSLISQILRQSHLLLSSKGLVLCCVLICQIQAYFIFTNMWNCAIQQLHIVIA